MDRRRRLLERVAETWKAFNDSYAGLTEVLLKEAGVTGAWSVRDILAHLTTWEEEALKHLPLILTGGTPPVLRDLRGPRCLQRPHDGTEAAAVLVPGSRAAGGHARPRGRVHPERAEHQLIGDTRFRRRLRLDTYGHYPIHADAIRQWRKRRSV
jgi:hypothetical protein